MNISTEHIWTARTATAPTRQGGDEQGLHAATRFFNAASLHESCSECSVDEFAATVPHARRALLRKRAWRLATARYPLSGSQPSIARQPLSARRQYQTPYALKILYSCSSCSSWYVLPCMSLHLCVCVCTACVEVCARTTDAGIDNASARATNTHT